MSHSKFSASAATLADKAELGLFVIDREGRIALWNRWMERFALMDRAAVLNKPLEAVFADVGQTLPKAVADALIQNATTQLPQPQDAPPLALYASAEAKEKDLRLQQWLLVSPIGGEDGHSHCLVQAQDASAAMLCERQLRAQARELGETAQRLAERQTQIQSILDTAHDAIVSIDESGRITSANPAAEALFGIRGIEWKDKPVREYLPGFSAADAFAAPESSAVPAKAEDHFAYPTLGEKIPVVITTRVLPNQGRPTLLATIRDVSERAKAEHEIRHLAYFDALTELPNRTLFQDRLRQGLAQARRHGGWLAVMCLDLDHFKLINDSLGHDVGDQLLLAVARRLQSCLRADDTVARLGGDEFAVIQSNIQDPKESQVLAEKICTVLNRPFGLPAGELHTSASIGITLFQPSESEDRDPLKEADIAMYRAKQQGRNTFQFFEDSLQAAMHQRIDLERALRRALSRQEFELWYQPQMVLSTGELSGFEALLRWPQADGSFVSPVDFIPVAEETGQILPLGLSVLRMACRQLSDWLRQGGNVPTVSVNISAVQFEDHEFPKHLRLILDEFDIAPRNLILEITETVLMTNADRARQSLLELHELGTGLAIDDFGTGYSSLSYLKRFPVDKIKIDRSFVSDLTVDPDDAIIVSSVIDLGHNMGHSVVAEGVETQQQLEFLTSQHCDEVQGYFLSKPLPASKLTEFIDFEDPAQAPPADG